MADEDKTSKKDDDWMQKKWRPAMGWMYMIVCMMDMVVFPIMWSVLQMINHQGQITQWNPLTLQGAGLFHIAMGAVLGISAFGRTQEKLAGTAANPTATVSTQNVNMVGNTANGYGGGGMNSGFGGGSGGGFGAPAASNGFGSTPVAPAATPTGFGATSTPATPVTTGFGGKKAPPDPVFPEI